MFNAEEPMLKSFRVVVKDTKTQRYIEDESVDMVYNDNADTDLKQLIMNDADVAQAELPY